MPRKLVGFIFHRMTPYAYGVEKAEWSLAKGLVLNPTTVDANRAEGLRLRMEQILPRIEGNHELVHLKVHNYRKLFKVLE